jgi:hypothetical protein
MIKSNKFKFHRISEIGISMIAIFLIIGTVSNSVSIDNVFGKPINGDKKNCKSDFFSRTCCWAESNGSFIFERCETCLDMGDGTYGHCKTDDHPFREGNGKKDNAVPLGDSILSKQQQQ